MWIVSYAAPNGQDIVSYTVISDVTVNDMVNHMLKEYPGRNLRVVPSTDKLKGIKP